MGQGEKMKLTIFGASGGSGKHLVEQALEVGIKMSRADLAGFMLD